MSRVLFLVNHDVVIYNFRLELVEELIKMGHEVVISCPNGERINDLVKLGAKYIETKINRHSVNPFVDYSLLRHYKRIIKNEKPDIIFSYTIKPNIFGSIAAHHYCVPFVANITGLGTALENQGIRQKLLVLMYRKAFRNIQTVFFQNSDNQLFFEKHKIALGKHKLLPGSGVNLGRFSIQKYPTDGTLVFVFVGRIMKEKGIDYFLETAKYIKSKYKNCEFHVFGFIEKEYQGKLNEYAANGIVQYHGMVRNMFDVYGMAHCLVFPSFYPEGISNVLLEAASSGRPAITTDRPGCRETVDDNATGFIVPIKNQDALNDAVERFLLLPYSAKMQMGIAARKKVEKEFDRNIIVKKYIEEINL